MYCHILGMWTYRGYGLVNGFIDQLYTPLKTTSNYSTTTADFHTKSSQSALPVIAW
jgi:hypothetical protein